MEFVLGLDLQTLTSSCLGFQYMEEPLPRDSEWDDDKNACLSEYEADVCFLLVVRG